MVKIKLRQDGWFDAGKDFDNEWPNMHEQYKSKQILKDELMDIGEQESIEALEKALSGIPEVGHFIGRPYIRAGELCIKTPVEPYEAQLGSIS